MKRIFTLLTIIVCAFSASAQPYVTGTRTITFIDNSRSDRPVPTNFYYPANTAGSNVALASGTTKFPVVVFGHGFLIATSAYKWMADSLVKRGYIVAFPSTEDGILPNHINFAGDLTFLCGRITSLNDSASSFLYQRVIKKAAIGGHSMGGGATFLAAATSPSSVNAVFNFAAAETTPPASLAAFLDFKPTLVISGSADCIAKDSVQEAMYSNIFLACKTYVNFTAAQHCQFANNNLICVGGQLASGCGLPSFNNSVLFTKTMSLLGPFLDYYLKNICIGGQTFVANYNNLTGITEKRRSCLPYPSCGPVPVTLTSFTGNIKNDKAYIYWNTAAEYNVDHMTIERSADGITFGDMARVSPKGSNSNGSSYNTIDPYPFAGVSFYRLKTIDLDGSISYSNIIKLVTNKKAIAITQLYPNPVQDILHIQLQSEKRQVVQVSVFDIAGKLVHSNATTLNTGINETVIPFAAFEKGTYILQYKNEQGGNLSTFKVVKN